MTRLAMLRAGYATLGLAFGALAAGSLVPLLVIPGLVVALVGGILLAFSQDELPKWAGIVLVIYFVVTVLAFLAANPVTINFRGERYFVNDAPAGAMTEITRWVSLASPLMLAGAAIASVWERERAPRTLLFGALGGFLLVALLSIVLVPTGVSQANAQSALLQTLFAVSALAGAAGTFWAAAHPEATR